MILKLQYFGHLIQRTDSLEKALMLGKIEGKRPREWQRMRWLVSITDSMDMNPANSGRKWRTEWQPTPAFLPGESHGWRNLSGYGSQGRIELDRTEARMCIPALFTISKIWKQPKHLSIDEQIKKM